MLYIFIMFLLYLALKANYERSLSRSAETALTTHKDRNIQEKMEVNIIFSGRTLMIVDIPYQCKGLEIQDKV